MDKTALSGFEGGVFDPREPKTDRYKRDPQRDYDFFMKNIPKKEDLKSVRDHEVSSGFIAESLDEAKQAVEILRKSLVEICATYEVVEQKSLLKKTGAILKLFEKPFELDAVRSGIVGLMEIEGELMYSLAVFGGGQGVQYGNCRAAKKAFVRLLEIF